MAKINSFHHGQVVVEDTSGNTSHALSALWQIDILVDRDHERIFLRLSDAHADEELAFIYTSAIEAASGKITLTTNEPSASRHHWSSEENWVPLVEGHFTYDIPSECFRTSSLRIMNAAGALKHLCDAIEDYAKKTKLGVPLFGRSDQMSVSQLAVHLPGKTRTALPRWGKAGNAAGAGHRQPPPNSLSQTLNTLANIVPNIVAPAKPGQTPGQATGGQVTPPAATPTTTPAVKKPMTFNKNKQTDKWF